MQIALEKLLKVGIKTEHNSVWGASVNECSVYQTAEKKLIFVKENEEPGVTYNMTYLIKIKEKKDKTFI